MELLAAMPRSVRYEMVGAANRAMGQVVMALEFESPLPLLPLSGYVAAHPGRRKPLFSELQRRGMRVSCNAESLIGR